MNPAISGMCLTYGRPALLEEAIQCFLDQKCDVPIELVIFNTCQYQKLELNPSVKADNIRIINCDKRPESLGYSRNIATELALGRHILIHDDDDLYLPNHYQNFANHFDGNDWLWMSAQFYSLGNEIKEITGGGQNVVAFTKDAWAKVGKYANLNCGEDRDFVGRLTKAYQGSKIGLAPEEVSFIYRWGLGNFHVSGLGDDEKQKVNAWKRAEIDFLNRVRLRKEKVGKIVLNPHLKRDYVSMAYAFTHKSAQLNQPVVYQDAVSCAPEADTAVFHCVERHTERNAVELSRKRHAWESWDLLYKSHGVIPKHYSSYQRSALQLGDTLDLPYLKDVLANGMKDAGPDDIILWTNDDTVLHPKVCDLLREHLKSHPAVSSHRCEFKIHPPPLRFTPEQWAKANVNRVHNGRDLFAFKKSWLVQHWDEIPDFILGASEFDVFLTVLIRGYYWIESPRSDLGIVMPPAEIPKGYVGHVHHAPKWNLRQRYGNAPAQTHNINLYRTNIGRYIGQASNDPLKSSKVAIVQLGRFGDIINMLPVCKLIAERHANPTLVVSRQFASVLDGVSYVDPCVIELDNSELTKAVAWAKTKFNVVVRSQIWGNDHQQPRLCRSFGEESWRELGFLGEFDNALLRVEFDRRDLAREQALCNRVIKGDKPVILVNTTESKSSPFEKGGEFLYAIKAKFGDDFEIVNLAGVKATRIYDLLGLMDKAVLLVSIDTALIHLASASGIPVVALVNNGWLGSVPRCNLKARITYAEAIADEGLVFDAIRNALKAERVEPIQSPVIAPDKRRIFHAVERHGSNPDQRTIEAQASWDVLYERGVIPCHLWEYPRSAKDIGDVRDLPYLKDVLQNAMDQASDSDIIMFTNDDNWLHPSLADYIHFHVSVYGPCSSQRCEFKQCQIPRSPTVDECCKLSESHMGRDLFAFTKAWLLDMWEEIPDFILGASDWDLCMALMIRLHHGKPVERESIEPTYFPAEIPRGYVSHQWHEAYWTRPDNESEAQSQVHNRTLFFQWAKANVPSLKFNCNHTI